jgi:hypothetical protein
MLMRHSEGLGLTLATPMRKRPSRPTAWPDGVWTAAASVKIARRVPFRAVLFHRRRQTCCTRRARALFQLSQLLPSPKRRRSPPPRTEPRLCRPRQISSQVSWVAVVNDPFARRNSEKSSTCAGAAWPRVRGLSGRSADRSGSRCAQYGVFVFRVFFSEKQITNAPPG